MKKSIPLFIFMFILISSIFAFAISNSYQLHKFGDVITTDTFKFSLNSARWDTGDEYSKPESGKKWLVIDCTIQNISKEPVMVSSMLMLSLFDDEGYAQDMSFLAQVKGSLDGSLAPSQKMRGEIAYEVNESCSSWELAFKPDILYPNQYFYSIVKEQIK